MNFAWTPELNTTLIGVRSTRLKYILLPLNSKTLIYVSSSVGYTLQFKERWVCSPDLWSFFSSIMNFAWTPKLNTTLIEVRSTRLKYILLPLNLKTLIYMGSSVGYTLQFKERWVCSPDLWSFSFLVNEFCMDSGAKQNLNRSEEYTIKIYCTPIKFENPSLHGV